MSESNIKFLANDVVAHFEREAFQHSMMDTATLYKFLLYVPSDVLVDYLFTVYGREYSDEPSI